MKAIETTEMPRNPALYPIYIPAPGTYIHNLVAPHSAIIGNNDCDGNTRLVYYEGNTLGYSNVKTFCDKAVIAAGRMREHYPTIARMCVPPSHLIYVGELDYEWRHILIPNQDFEKLLAEWLGMPSVSESELHCNPGRTW